MDRATELERRRLLEEVRGFLSPSSPGFSGEESPKQAMELSVALATRLLVDAGKVGAIALLRQAINDALAKCEKARHRDVWENADAVCFQALSLYLKLADESGLGWPERQAVILPQLIDIYWRLPDRFVGQREEKTNCMSYLENELCMQKSKKLIFSWVVGRWTLDLRPFEAAKGNIVTAFAFICDVFKQEEQSSGRKTTPRNIKLLTSHSSGHALVNERRKLMPEEKSLYVHILMQHCERAKPEQLRPWVKDDLPVEIIELFQGVLIRTGDTSIALQLLKSIPVPA